MADWTVAIAATRRAKAPTAASFTLDAKAARRVQAAAKDLSKALGRDVPADLVLNASIEVMAALCKALAAKSRAKKT